MESALSVSAKMLSSAFASYTGHNIMKLFEDGKQDEDLDVEKSRQAYIKVLNINSLYGEYLIQ